jgi:nucleotide-binding universal stress UspA family protein
MYVMHTIIVPLDGSQVAEDALAPARGIVAATQAHLVLVQGVQFTVASHQQEVAAHAAVTEAQRYLRTVAEHLEREGITARAEVLPGTPEQAILFAAQVHQADLIVISTHGRSALRHVFAGSVAEAVLRHAECPVLITHPGNKAPAGEQSARRILVPLDGSPLSEAALAYLTSEQLGAGAHVILLRVVERPALSGAPLVTGQASDEFFAYADAQVAKDQESAEQYLSALGERYLQGVEWEKHVVVGYAVEDIVHCAKELRAGLIVMASEGRHGFERLLYGSVAGRVLRHAPMPVLVVHDVSSQ